MNDAGEASSALSDWILGTNFGIVSGSIDTSQKSVMLTLPADRLESLTEQDKQDIHAAIVDILALHLSASSAAQEYSIQYRAGGQITGNTSIPDDTSAQASPEGEGVAAADDPYL